LANQLWGLCWVIYDEPGDVKPVVDAAGPIRVNVDPRPLHGAIEGLYVETVGAAEGSVMLRWVELIQLLVNRILQPYRTDDRLWRVWAQVDADVGRAWTLTELARLACLSDEHLRRLTRRQLGRSPMEQVTWLRMRKAAGLLASTPHKIETIGRAVGYENPFAFSTAFKRCMGKSPSTYRQAGMP
jgi:AraC-like DNA-binding protein